MRKHEPTSIRLHIRLKPPALLFMCKVIQLEMLFPMLASRPIRGEEGKTTVVILEPFHIRLCAFDLNRSVCFNDYWLQRCCLFVVHMHAIDYVSFSETKNELHQDLFRLLRCLHVSDTVVIVEDFKAQVEYLRQTEQICGGSVTDSTNCTYWDNQYF